MQEHDRSGVYCAISHTGHFLLIVLSTPCLDTLLIPIWQTSRVWLSPCPQEMLTRLLLNGANSHLLGYLLLWWDPSGLS